MKKWLWIAAALMGCLYFSGCGASLSAAEHLVGNSRIIYRVYEENNTGRNIQIEYPWLQGGIYEDNENEAAAANQIIWNTLLQWLQHTYGRAGSQDAPLNLVMKSQLSLTDDCFLSVVETGVGYIWGQPYPHNWLVSIHIDLRTGQRIRLADMYDIRADFVQTYRRWAQEQWQDEPGRLSWLQEQDDSVLLALLRQCDDITGGSWSYRKDGQIFIILPGPHALGDYIPAAIPAEALTGFLYK